SRPHAQSEPAAGRTDADGHQRHREAGLGLLLERVPAAGESQVRRARRSRISPSSSSDRVGAGGTAGAGGGVRRIRLITLMIANIAIAMIRKEKQACTNIPYLSSTAPPLGSVPICTAILLKSTRPMTSPSGGMMTFATSELTTVPNAPPITKPTARSITLPLTANSLNSLHRLMVGTSPSGVPSLADRLGWRKKDNGAG